MNGSAPEKQTRIFIDAGHGGSDPGAVNPREHIKESDVALAIGKLLDDALREIIPVLVIKHARYDDRHISIEDRVAAAEEFKADIFISVHCNAAEDPQASGFEVWTSRGQTQADRLATAIHEALLGVMGGHYGRTDYDDGDPDKEANFYVLRHTSMPAVLVEGEFISNDDQAVYLSLEENQADIAWAIAEAVSAYLGLGG